MYGKAYNDSSYSGMSLKSKTLQVFGYYKWDIPIVIYLSYNGVRKIKKIIETDLT